MSRFFIDRPIFASVLSIVITLAGALAVFTLPIAQYPPVAPPTVQVDCNYPGASAQVVSQTVASPIEQLVNGVQDMLYMSSQCTSDGSYSLTVTFKPGINLNLAQVLVQNRVSLAMPSLPDVVRQTGVTTRKRSPDILLTVSLNSPDHADVYDQLYLSNYAVLHIKDELARLPGISEVLVFGQRDYSMRIWLDPDVMTVRGVAASDVINALREQNLQVAAGQVGEPPGTGQILQVPLSTLGRLQEVSQFENVIVRSTREGRALRIKDIGRVELSAKSHDVSNRFDRKPTVGIAVFQLPDANALDTADLIKAKMKELKAEFPPGVEYEIGYDTTPFIRESVGEVFNALRDAIILVAIVVLVFLQGWRAAIIPLIAVPVAIVGTFAAMAVVGFSLNNLTLFGLVLAIGIVVDDAIVVVEAVEHHIERGLKPRQAAIHAMDEVSGPVIAVGLVLSAVFIPCAFISGIVGQFFRQFALTIAISTIISTFNSLTLSPALAALLLKPKKNGRTEALPRLGIILAGAIAGYLWLPEWVRPHLGNTLENMRLSADVLPWICAPICAVGAWATAWLFNLALDWFFWVFNRGFNFATTGYVGSVGLMLRMPSIVLLVYGGLVVLTWWGFRQLPTGFIPGQDKGYLIASVQLPDSAAVSRTSDTMAKIEQICLSTPGVKNVNSVIGNSFILGAYGSNFGSMFIILKTFDQRKDHDQSSDAIVGKLRKRFATDFPEALVNVFPPPAVSGLGRAGGFKFMVEDRGDNGLVRLQQETDNLVAKANKTPGLTGLFTVYKANSPQLFADINREECIKQGVELGDVFSTLQAYLGSRYVNDFNRFGRTWQVIVQADAHFRNEVKDVKRLTVRNRRGLMVPIGSLCTVREISSPLVLSRYNMYPAAAINGAVAQGFSTGQAIEAFEALARRELPTSMSFEWTEITFIERMAGNTGMVVFAFSVIFVFLVLAALYESWTLPLAVILVVPMCVLSSIAGVAYMKMDINIFTQIGFVVLIGLASKNAILIVEFAKYRREEGVPRREATLHACSLRLRPIMMTSFAFILGVLPLVAAHGAGAEMRRALGTAVFSGMLGVTFFGIFLTPVFFYVIDWFSDQRLFSVATLQRLGGAGDIIRRPISQGVVWMKAAFKAKPQSEQPRRTAVAAAGTNGNGSNGSVAAGVNGNGAVHSHPDIDEPLVASETAPPT